MITVIHNPDMVILSQPGLRLATVEHRIEQLKKVMRSEIYNIMIIMANPRAGSSIGHWPGAKAEHL